MPQPQGFEILILCSGAGGKLLAWQTAISGRQTAVIEYRWIGGSCPNIGCLPSKNEIWSAKVIHRALNAEPFGTATGTIAIDMGKVRQRKREMSEKEIATHLLPLRQRVTVIEGGTRLMGGEDERVQTAILADLPCLTLPDDILARQTMVNALGPPYATVPFRPGQSVVLKNMTPCPDSNSEPLTQAYVAPLWEARS